MELRQPYSRHPEWFKLEVVKFYYDHAEDRKLTLREYEIDHSCLRDWLRKYGSREKALSLYVQTQRDMRKQKKQLPSDPNAAQAEYERLQEELELAQMRAKGLDVMIDLAEQEYGLKIRKKCGAKQ
jgi:transposase-like protein